MIHIVVGTDVLDDPLQTQRLAINIVSLIRTVEDVGPYNLIVHFAYKISVF